MSGSERRRLPARVTLRLASAESEALRAAARADGLTLSDWSRRTLCDAAARPVQSRPHRKRFDHQALITLAGRVAQAGGLLQILRLEARAGHADPSAIERVAHAFEALRAPLLQALHDTDDHEAGP